MCVYSIRLTDSEKAALESYSKANGITMSEALKGAFISMLEDEYDIKAADKTWRSTERIQRPSHQMIFTRSKAYKLFFTPGVDKKLEKMDAGVRKIILKWLKKNVGGCADPKAHGKALSENRAGERRYRIGDYRVICLIDDGKLIVIAIDIVNRREIYK